MKLYSDKIILKDGIINGVIEINENTVSQIKLGETDKKDAWDFTGKVIMPGLINIQSNSFMHDCEKEYFSRYPDFKAFTHIERVNAISGVTSIFHNFDIPRMQPYLSVEEITDKINFVKAYKERKHIINHHVNVKFKLGDIDSDEFIEKLLKNGTVDLLHFVGGCSDLDFTNDYFFEYLKKRYNISERTAWAVIERLDKLKKEIALEELAYKLKYASEYNVPVATSAYALASYDPEIKILIDPFEPEDTEYARKSGKYATIDINNLWDFDKISKYASGITDCTYNILTASHNCYDFLESVFYIGDDIGLIKAVCMATYNPAVAVGLKNKGEIAEGKDADLIVVDVSDKVPQSIMTVCGGKVIARVDYIDGI